MVAVAGSMRIRIRIRIRPEQASGRRRFGRFRCIPPVSLATNSTGSPTPTPTPTECVTATLKRPLGLNLKEDAVAKTVVIESIEKGSNADLAGVFAAGDRLVACSAVMMVTEEEAKSGMIYNRDARGKKGGCCSTGCSDCPFNARNWQRVMFDCRGKNFETVIAALQSNFQARWLARGAAQDVSITVTVER